MESFGAIKNARYLSGTVDRPGVGSPPDRVVPLLEPCLFSEMDLLSLANQTHHQGPRVLARPDVQEVLRLGTIMSALLLDALGVPGPLGLVVDPDVFLRRAGARPTVLLEKAVDVLDDH